MINTLHSYFGMPITMHFHFISKNLNIHIACVSRFHKVFNQLKVLWMVNLCCIALPFIFIPLTSITKRFKHKTNTAVYSKYNHMQLRHTHQNTVRDTPHVSNVTSHHCLTNHIVKQTQSKRNLYKYNQTIEDG